jgi:hypothetical protein
VFRWDSHRDIKLMMQNLLEILNEFQENGIVHRNIVPQKFRLKKAGLLLPNEF